MRRLDKQTTMNGRRKATARVLTLWVKNDGEIKAGTLDHLQLDYIQPIQLEIIRSKAEELHRVLGELLRNPGKGSISIQITGRMTVD